MLHALQTICERLQGSYAIALIDIHDPETIYAVSHESPLVIGLSDNGNFLASTKLHL